MKAQNLLRKLKLPESSLENIQKAVHAAETRTTGEIAVAAIPESSDYSFYELFASVLLGALVFAILLPLNGLIAGFIGNFFWIDADWHATAVTGIVSFGVIAIFFLVANIPAIDRIVISRHVKKSRVYNRAIRHFVESGVYATAERTGILIFISYMEREVRIVADEGINKKITQEIWSAIAANIATGIREGKTEEALVTAIASCGELLAQHFPAKDDNPNELPDGLVILEAGE